MNDNSYTDRVRKALRDAINGAPDKNPNMCTEDKILAPLYISGFKIVPTENAK